MWSLRARSGFVSRLPHAFDARRGDTGDTRPGRGPLAPHAADAESGGEARPAHAAQHPTRTAPAWR
ncbi:hypothetical protein LG943_10555 [Streptomonospora sp. S1-112]|uniref:Uncharacterized protein n=1 Tax=Streptomonospora mangrovi TaxID=2883123 RepID=A0A9X3SN29_9ACTN|nr:hypothetical protein [Streptomonospora mangrovi]MDA0564761.1 hypothetical protein [Streptomonospora mangrovi]